MSFNINDMTDCPNPWLFDASHSLYKNCDAALPENVYVRNDNIRSELTSSLYKNVQYYLSTLRGHAKDKSTWHIMGIGTDIDKRTGVGIMLTLDIYFNHAKASIWCNKDIQLFLGSRDDVRIFLGKMIGNDAADALFLSIMLQ